MFAKEVLDISCGNSFMASVYMGETSTDGF